jgi:1,4-alpha-glucan branching enzyme
MRAAIRYRNISERSNSDLEGLVGKLVTRHVMGENNHNCVFAWLRRAAPDSREVVLGVGNMTPVPRYYRLGVPYAGTWQERLNTDAAVYGGSNVGNGGAVAAADVPSHGQPASLSLTLPPLATLVLRFDQAGGAPGAST